jgi:signal transduction histidine kinase
LEKTIMTTHSPAAAPPESVTTASVTGDFRYPQMWALVPRELVYLLLGYPIALVGFIASITLFFTGVGSLITFVGIFLIIAALYVGRGFGSLDLNRLEWAGRPRIERPEWEDARAKQGFWGWLRALFGNGHYWLYLLYSLVISFVVTLVSWIVAVVWVSAGVVGTLAWLVALIFPGSFGGTDPVIELGWLPTDSPGALVWALFVQFVIGVAALATLPYVTRLLVLGHYFIARGVLGPFRSDALRREVIALSSSRTAAVSAEGHSLRRLERDIHDGPQQRLVRMQMDLSAAERQLDNDPQRARVLIAEAMAQSKEALEELRALSRGFAPPILLDRGLVAALESAAIRSAVPTRVVSDLPRIPSADPNALPQEIERNAYFVASEAIMNAGKHSGATDIEVRVDLRRVAETDDTWLVVTVTDNGRGGAVMVAGHGLAGLAERMQGLGGVLEVLSPVGGPTTVRAHLPVTSTLARSV